MNPRIWTGLFVVLIAIGFSTSAMAYQFLYTCGPTWANLPVNYRINENGSADVPINTVEQIVADSFEEWGRPCCSDFRASYTGRTALTAINNQGHIVFSWEENQWDPRFGRVNSTIAVTLIQVTNRCHIVQAPILYNGVGFRFTTNGSGTDLQAITTHEIGHLLGLDHTNIQQATMFAAYVGGTGARTLHQDDVNGVCALYTRSCSCNGPADCVAPNECIDNLCRIPPCTNNSQCDTGLECDLASGECIVPPCDGNQDCQDGFICSNRRCVSACPTCRSCTSNSECGGNAFCADTGAGSRCIVECDQGGLCPGDSICYQYQGYYICLNPNAEQVGICPDDYVCQLDATDDRCQEDPDCPPGFVCNQTAAGRRCEVDMSDPCAGVTCDPGFACQSGECVATQSGENNQPGPGDPDDEDDEDVVIIVNPGSSGQKFDDGGCGGCQSSEPLPQAWPVVLVLLGIGLVRRRRDTR